MARTYCRCGAPEFPTLNGEKHPWCRVCWVMRTGSTMDMADYPAWTSNPPVQMLTDHGRALIDVADCNSTEGTQATANWLPEPAYTFLFLPVPVTNLRDDGQRYEATMNRATFWDWHESDP